MFPIHIPMCVTHRLLLAYRYMALLPLITHSCSFIWHSLHPFLWQLRTPLSFLYPLTTPGALHAISPLATPCPPLLPLHWQTTFNSLPHRGTFIYFYDNIILPSCPSSFNIPSPSHFILPWQLISHVPSPCLLYALPLRLSSWPCVPLAPCSSSH